MGKSCMLTASIRLVFFSARAKGDSIKKIATNIILLILTIVFLYLKLPKIIAVVFC